MNPILEATIAKGDEYAQLPEGVRLHYTREQWLWLSDYEKATLLQRETECEYDH